MRKFKINSEFIELSQLLKVTGPLLSGGQAKFVISQGLVLVDDQKELRKKCKIRPGQTVKFEQFIIKVE